MRIRSCLVATLALWAAVTGVARAEDLVVTSFDGTPIVAHWFPNPSLGPGDKAPVVLNGPGWSSPGANDPSEGAIKRLHGQGYNVLTWDPRGFGVSGGVVQINAPQTEGRDVKALIDQMAREPEVLLDRAGDPRVGMTGGSYGGGIQLSTAGIDRRLDALVPVVAWHSLETSLFKDRTFKQGWNSLLYAAGKSAAENGGLAGGPAGVQTGGLDPHITSAYDSALATGTVSAEDEQWFRDRGPGDATIAKIRTPTMVVAGTVDTLFPLDEDIKIYRRIKASGVPTKLFWFCGGHGQCAEGNGGEEGAGLDVGSILGSGAGDPRLDAATEAWLERYLKKNRRVDTGPEFEFLSDDRKYRVAPQYPVAPGRPLRARGAGTLAISESATSGSPIFSAPVDSGALEVPITARRGGQLLGAPRLKLTYRGTGAPAVTRVFALIVSVARGVAVGNQATPIPVELDGKRHTVSRSLVPIASTARRGARYKLQLIAGTAVWAKQRTNGSLKASRIEIELQVADPRGLGRNGVRCSVRRRFTVKPSRRLRSVVVGGRVMLGRKRLGRVKAGGKGVRVRLARTASGRKKLRLVLSLSDGSTVTERRMLWLCAP